MIRPRVGLLAVIAFELLVSGVNLQVTIQRALVGELAVADLAKEDLLVVFV